MRTLAPLAVLMILSAAGRPAGLVAQFTERPLPTAAACEVMTNALSAIPVPQPADSAWDLVGACDGGGEAFAAAIGHAASSSDTALHNRIRLTARRFRDGHAFDAFKLLALNTGASVAARATGFYGFLYALNPAFRLLQPITTELPAGSGCPFTIVLPSPNAEGAPLPAEAPYRIASTARTVLESGAPAPVKAAARCAAWFVRGLAPDIAVAKLVLTYGCGNIFNITNTNPASAVVRYTVDGSSERATVNVPTMEKVMIIVHSSGVVRLWLRNFQFTSQENLGTPCP